MGLGRSARVCVYDDSEECYVMYGLTESLVRTKLSTSMVRVAGPSLGFSASAFFWRAMAMRVGGCG